MHQWNEEISYHKMFFLEEEEHVFVIDILSIEITVPHTNRDSICCLCIGLIIKTSCFSFQQ